MTDDDLKSVTVTRDLPFPVDRVWRALTQADLLSDWLMQTDFVPEVGRAFRFTADWGHVEGEVIEITLQKRLVYSWNAHDLRSTVTFTLTPTPEGTRLEMVQRGFRPDQGQAYGGARFGWTRMFETLAALLAEHDKSEE